MSRFWLLPNKEWKKFKSIIKVKSETSQTGNLPQKSRMMKQLTIEQWQRIKRWINGEIKILKMERL